MSLSFKDFLSFFFREKGAGKHEDEINRYIFISSINKMRLISTLVALLMICALFASFMPAHSDKPYVVSYRYIYLSMLILMSVSITIMTRASKDINRHLTVLSRLIIIEASLIYAWAIVAMILNAYALGFVNPSLYIATALLIPFCAYMPSRIYVFVAVVTDTAMLIAYHRLSQLFLSPVPKTVVIAVILGFIFAITLGLYFLQHTLREKSLNYEDQKGEIDELSRAQNRFFSSMSHEIRTPINTIIGLNEMILREKVSDEVAENAANIKAASNMLLHLINDILDMSKISSGQMKLTPVAYRPGDMLSELVGMLWLRAKEKGLDFHVEVAPDIPSELYGDEVRIKQILINVLNNAIKYTKKGSVTLSIQCNGIHDGVADIVYSVKDTGTGIKKESIPYLFTAFKRVDEEQNRHIEGTGLGLAIVKELTGLMGGNVSVNSVYTQGSTFVIEIPQTVTDYSEIGKLSLEEKHRLNTSGSYRAAFTAPKAEVLAVDDNESNLLVIRKLLRDTKVRLDTVTSGAAALEKTLEKSYDVIFMDHLMPEMDGIECLKKIRTQTGGISKGARVIALTANAGSEMRKLYLGEGFDGYLVKPVDVAELETALMHYLPKDKVSVKEKDDNIIENSMLWMADNRRKKPVAITTDSIADIPRTLMEEYGIESISHKVVTKSGVFADNEEIDSDGLLDYLKDNLYVRTHAPSVKEHEDFFAKALAGANNVIHVSISSDVNNSGYWEAKDGAAAFDNVTVFDSKHLSSGQGLVTLAACRMAAEGLSAADIISRLTFMRNHVHTTFIVDNLDYLARSGQVSGRIAGLCKAVMFHPVINMKNGRMSVRRFYFGSKLHAWNRYISSCLSRISDIDTDTLFITYVGISKKEMDQILEMVNSKATFEHIYIQKASPTIAVNAGPGTFGLLYAEKM